MNTQNKEDIPTRNFKKKKKQQKHPKLETDDFPRGKTKQKKRKTTTTASETLKNFQILPRN